MTISPTTRLTTKQKNTLNNMNYASQLVGGLGARLDSIQYNGIPTIPSPGVVVALHPIKYTLAPALHTNTYVHAATALTASPQTISTAITNPDYPRLLVAVGNASGIVDVVAFTGTDINDAPLTESVTLNGTAVVPTTKAFKTLTSYVLPAKTNSSGDTVSIGVADKFGFPVAIPNTSLVLVKSFNLLVDSSTITVGTTAALSLAAPAGTPDGVKLYELTFLG